MQHHAHAPPAPQPGTNHMHGHHMAPPPGQQHRPLSMAHAAPPPRAPQQAHPQQKHHVNSNNAVPGMPPSGVTAGQLPPPQHLRNRMGHQQHSMHLQANSVPKMRPPHHMNINNNKLLNKNNYNAPLQYNHTNGPPQQQMVGGQQQQHQHPPHRNMRSPSHHQYQPKGHALHMKNQQHASNHKSYQYQQQMQQSSQRQQQPNPYYAAGNKSKVSNSKSATNISPKKILQNPNRLIKPKTNAEDVEAVANADASTDPASGVAASSDVVVKETNDVVEVEAEVPREYNADTEKSAALEDQLEESDKENLRDKSAEGRRSSKERSMKNDQSNILPNVDDMADRRSSNDKTAMCLVNELARFNQISHQYRLTSENGPPHSKRFTVTLTLGEEEFSADGCKIKKAQHMAAAEAIKNTKYKHPTPKPQRRIDENCAPRPAITPTVELNALAMKLGQQTFYLTDPRLSPQSEHMSTSPDGVLTPYGSASSQAQPLNGHLMQSSVRMMEPTPYMRRNGGARGGYMPPPPHGQPPLGAPPPPPYAHGRPGLRPYPPQRYNAQRHLMMPPHPVLGGMPPALHHAYNAGFPPCKVTLIVGKQKFIGIGRTLQQAKHDAASRALQVLRKQATDELNEALDRSLSESDSKSPISLVHEIGIKRKMSVHFKVLLEEGPAHMKKFVTACIVGNIVTEAEGNGKKVSKKRAAEKMLEELKKLAPLSPAKTPVKRVKAPKTPIKPNCGAASGERRKRMSNTIKDVTDAEADVNNPVTKLIQLQQQRKEKEPVFELIAKNGIENSHRREFIIEAMVEGQAARGTGGTKKMAKRNAAQNLLVTLGVENDSSSKTDKKILRKSHTKVRANNNNTETEANEEEQKEQETKQAPTTSSAAAQVSSEAPDLPVVSTTAGPVPGILILRQSKKNALKKKEVESKKLETETPAAVSSTSAKASATDDAAKAATNTPTTTTTAAVSPTPTVTSTAATSSTTSTTSAHMKDQLLYLAKLLGFEVGFSDYPKGNHNEFLTIVTLSTDPSQICHGVGTSSAESQNDAAKNALKILSELGLNNMKK